MPHSPGEKPAHRWIALTTRISVGVGALLVALLITAVLVKTAPQTRPTDTQAQATKVPVIELRRVEVGRQWRGLGTVQPVHKARVPARVSAAVVSIPGGMDAGARARRGDTLVRLDAEDFIQQAEIARQTVADLEARLTQLDVQQKRLDQRRELEEELLTIAVEERQRVERIYESGAGSQQGVDRSRRLAIEADRALSATLEQLETLAPQRSQINAQVASQNASLRLAELAVSRCDVQSPIDGIVQSLDVEVGENLGLGQTVAMVVGLSNVEVPLNVPASARADLALGDPVSLRSASEGGPWEARVSRILPQDDPTARTATFFAELTQDNAEQRFGTPAGADLLTPGTFVTGMVTSDTKRPRWAIPRRSVRSGRVLLVRNGVVLSCEVSPDFTYEGNLPGFGIADDQWVVLDDQAVPFTEGDQLILNVSVGLSDGARVEPVVQGDALTVMPGDTPRKVRADDVSGGATP